MEKYFFQDLGRFGESVALISPKENREITYRELEQLIKTSQSQFPKTRGLAFVETDNTISSIVNYLAVLSAGHPAHIMESFETEKGRALIETYSPNLLISDDAVIVNAEHSDDLHPDLAILLSTSGSTGSPKFVKLSKSNLNANTNSIAKYLALESKDRAFCHLKPYYSFGMSILNSHLSCGASIILSENSMIEDAFWEELKTYAATSFSGVPYNFETLKRQGFSCKDFPSLRYATQAGGKLDAELVTHFARDFAAEGKEFFVMYGQTEAAPRMSYLPPSLALKHPNSIGRTVPGGRLFLLDEDRTEITDIGKEGELAYEGPNVMMGYANSRDELITDETPERLLTGDIACRLLQDPEGDLFQIVGRASRFIKPFGSRVGLDEVQSFVKQTYPVSAATGTDALLVIGLEADDTPTIREKIEIDCADRFGLPRSIIKVMFFDELPLLATGKVDYRGILDAATQEQKLPPLVRLKNRINQALGFDETKVETVGEAFQKVLLLSDISPEQSFEKLGADSLSYVSLSLELEDIWDSDLPEDWTTIPIEDLEQMRETAMLKSA